MVSSMRLSPEQSSVGLRVALRIISAWEATPAQACKILRISLSTYRRVIADGHQCRRLDRDQQQRIGLVLGIHATLRTIFTNQANVRSFPRLKNENDFFAGGSPLEFMSQGSMISLYETFRHVEQLKLPCHQAAMSFQFLNSGGLTDATH
ncbi:MULTISPECIES: antitoxin Xre-like helix-turn-helix domain-containing protein [Pseudomonas]|uniref:antitoxin Xre-like helix-turn-helix domain-containing protein n=1 Tax=Pseudomonas TaxID=286 RepID=UPI001CED0C92|nr:MULTISPECIES: antitoxin Xre-like helix-turn-helix domain-containing protein [Pseudomonas]MCY4123727.1 hypothetical protein [Pseudomonas sp.]WKU95557.1 hypothetical protein Q3407_22800 [Pseudomonas fulva]